MSTEGPQTHDATSEHSPVGSFRIPPLGVVNALCIVLALLYAAGVLWGLPSSLTPASDSPAPIDPLNWIARYRDTKVAYVYPPIHQLVCAFIYTLVLSGWKAIGLIGTLSKEYPYGFRRPALIFSSLIVATNLIAVVMALATLRFMSRFRLTERSNVCYAMCLLGLGGIFTYYARVGNLDVPYVFWVVLSFVFIWKYLFAESLLRWVAVAGVAGALAVGTKDQAVGMEFGFGLSLLVIRPDQGPGIIRQRIKAAAAYAALLLLTYGVSSIAVNPWRWWAHILFVTSDHVAPEYSATVSGQFHLLLRSITRMSHILSYEGIVLGVVGWLWLVKMGMHRKAAALLIPAAAYYVAIIMKVRATEERYLLPIAFLLALCAGTAAGELLFRSRSNRVAYIAVILILGGSVADQMVRGFIPVTYCQVFDTKLRLARDLVRLIPKGSSLLAIKMVRFNLPNSNVYENYPLMLLPGRTLFPATNLGQHLLQPYNGGYRYVLAGNSDDLEWHGVLASEQWPDTGPLVGKWTYPRWIIRNVYVPCRFEFFLYERKDQERTTQLGGESERDLATLGPQ